MLLGSSQSLDYNQSHSCTVLSQGVGDNNIRILILVCITIHSLATYVHTPYCTLLTICAGVKRQFALHEYDASQNYRVFSLLFILIGSSLTTEDCIPASFFFPCADNAFRHVSLGSALRCYCECEDWLLYGLD